MNFKTKRLHIRPIKENEYTELLKIYRVQNNMRYIFDGKFDWTLEELQHKLTKFSGKGNTFCIVIHLATQKIIGEAVLLKRKNFSNDELEIGYLLDEKHCGLGLGTELCKGLMKYCFEELGLSRLEASLYKENINSAALLKKVGFTLFKSGKIPSGLEYEIYEFPFISYDFNRK